MHENNARRPATCTAAAGAGLIAAIGLALTAPIADLVATPANASEINIENGAAIEGYDPVAYFTEGRPVPGSPDITLDHRGALYRFASEANRALFTAAPDRYLPAYGGYCAYGLSRGYKAPIDPAAFTIVDGALYLNYSADIQATWRTDIAGYVAKADAHWPTVKLQ